MAPDAAVVAEVSASLETLQQHNRAKEFAGQNLSLQRAAEVNCIPHLPQRKAKKKKKSPQQKYV